MLPFIYRNVVCSDRLLLSQVNQANSQKADESQEQ